MYTKRHVKTAIGAFAVFLIICGIGLGGFLSGERGVQSAEATIVEVTKGIDDRNADFSAEYQSMKLRYEYRGEQYFDAFDGHSAFDNAKPGDKVTAYFYSDYPHAVFKLDNLVSDKDKGNAVNGWDFIGIFLLLPFVILAIVVLMMALTPNEPRNLSLKKFRVS